MSVVKVRRDNTVIPIIVHVSSLKATVFLHLTSKHSGVAA